ncbi:SIS domain-containing protein [Paenactinomyces guangxiensis]|uniref:SIS domain-containing protein n=1 Tax=Paenactinomyces guangxiensis TaxID=1490290 RepID=A0A7W1WQE9_9BACL|nr:SIS domain-containing protein [Paenactinomyces guangxiensis]MBA4494168.1 SIS domain-containing protein [Paenactinomyces guangxiensis]MBH8591087.1 SIS domain-containing protein [Paenactinomyces guangxiensis]
MDQLNTDGNRHTMKEIFQQPKLWRETVNMIEQQKEEIQAFLHDPLIRKKARVLFTGAGTSAYVGDTVTPCVSRKIPNRTESIPTTDIVANPMDYLHEHIPTILVSFARSGNSPESVGAYDLAEQIVKDIYQIVITCNREGSLAKKASSNSNSLVIYMPEESNDLGFAMTSSFSCMYLAALLLFDLDDLEAAKKKAAQIANHAQRILNEQLKEVQELVSLNKKRVVYLGSSTLKGLAKETCLKNLELTSGIIPTFWESILGFRHGPKSLIDDETLIFVFLSNDPYTRRYDLDLLRELHSDGGNKTIVAITYGDEPELYEWCGKVLVVSETEHSGLEDHFIALDYLLYGQLFAMFNSLSLGIDPDNPSPSGTVNRVVKGVHIHPFAN